MEEKNKSISKAKVSPKKTKASNVGKQKKSTKKPVVSDVEKQKKRLNKIYAVTTPNKTNAFTIADEKNNPFDYIPFGFDNALPRKLAELYRKASTNRAIINSKTQFTMGAGFESENEQTQEVINSIVSTESGENLNDIERKVAKDCWVFGNGYILISKTSKGDTESIFYDHTDATTVRLSVDKTEFIVHPNWFRYEEDKSIAVKYPVYPKFTNVAGAMRSMVQIKDYEPEWTYYGLPEYIGAYTDGSLDTDYLISKYNFDRFRNGFMPSAIIDVFADMDESDADNFIESMQEAFTNEDNSFKMFIRVMSEKDMETKVQFLTDELQGSFLSLMEANTTKIIRANRYFPELAGIQTPGKLAGTKEILNQFDLVMSSVIVPKQKMHLEVWNLLLTNENKIVNPELKIKNTVPISYTNLIDINATLDKNERRKILGFEEKDEEGVRESLQGAAVEEMLNIAQSVRDGRMPVENGIEMIIVAFGISREEAEAVIPTEIKPIPVKEIEPANPNTTN